MYTGRLIVGSLTLAVFLSLLPDGSQAALPRLGGKPVPQLDAGGPSAAVVSLAFSEDGQALYVAGLDKVVRVWALEKGQFVARTSYRVPIGPGNIGAVNAVAISPDGAWLAMAGRAPMQGEAGFSRGGTIIPAAFRSPEQAQDAGVIYVTRTGNPGAGKVLRGHRGEVRALAFAPASKGKPPLLVSAATERTLDPDSHKEWRFGGVRLWDVATGKMVGRGRSDLPATEIPPGLAVWHTGPGIDQVRVALAWQEEAGKKPSLYVWDPGYENSLYGFRADPRTATGAWLGSEGGAHIVTGGLGPPGRLQVWRLSGKQEPTAADLFQVPFPPRDRVNLLPVNLAVIPAAGVGGTSYAAVVLKPGAPGDYRLALVDLNQRTIVGDVALRGSSRIGDLRPALAARGEHIAVAATPDHAIQVYTVADLLAGKAEARVLAGQGLPLRRVAFVDQGRGLWLSANEEARPLAGGLLFDLEKQEVRANKGEAKLDAPEMGRWEQPILDPKRKIVTVSRGGVSVWSGQFPGKDLTAVALRPPGPGGRRGLLAVAWTERDASKTLIQLSDPETGKPLRQLVGHLHDVRELAFSGSRELLASVGDDQTVCVWSLKDLDKAVGEVEGLGVRDEKGADGKVRVVVRQVEPGTPAAKELANGDVIEKVGATGGEAKPIASAGEFVLAVSARAPGDKVVLTVAGKGARTLPVGRALEGRRPLFSLFLLRAGKLPEWVGWNPVGPYDCSSRAAESHLVWHTNTGNEADPVASAGAGEYRRKYHYEGILRYLAEEADLKNALDRWDKDHPGVAPKASLRPIQPDGARLEERAYEYLIRRKLPSLRIGVNPDYPVDEQHVLRWHLTRADGGNVRGDEARLSGQAKWTGTEWEVDLSGAVWRRGEYQLRVGLHARPEGPELPSAAETVRFRFLPEAPTLSLLLDGKAVPTTEQKPLMKMEEKLRVQVALGVTAGQEVEVQFAGFRNGEPYKEVPKSRVEKAAGRFDVEFKLKEGLERLVVRAANRGALPGQESEETTTQEVWIRYKVPELPPRITDVRLEPAPEVKRIDGQDVWVVSRSTVRLLAKLEAEGVLVEASWSDGKARKSVLPPRARRVDLDARLDLPTDKLVTIELRAKSQDSDPITAKYPMIFYPPLPSVSLDPPDSPDVLTEKITLGGAFRAETTDPATVRILVTSAEGKTRPFKPELDPKTGRWKAELTLFPGNNTIERFVANKWRPEQRAGEALQLNYLRPPKITAWPKEVEAVETNKVPLTLTVEGPPDRRLTGILVEQKPVRFPQDLEPKKLEHTWVWQVPLTEVFVHDGEKNLERIAVQAVNEEGTSQPVVVRVIHSKKPPRPPVARFIPPTTEGPVDRPGYTAAFRVESEHPLQRVEIRRDDKVLAESDLKRVVREGKRFVLQGELPVQLQTGVNRLELVAVNKDGRSPSASVVISLVEPPVAVEIDRVLQLKENGDVLKEMKPTYTSDGKVVFTEPAPASVMWLEGHVRWASDAKGPALNDRGLAPEVKVGDCRQFPESLKARGTGKEANIRRFRVPVVLTGQENRLRISLPSVSQHERSCREFTLTCRDPAKNQRLHLLIVGVNVTDPAQLKKRVLDALGAMHQPKGNQGEFDRRPPFEQCYLHGTLTGEVTRGHILGKLGEIKELIKTLNEGKKRLNDVVLVYYQGEDVVVPQTRERWLKTSRKCPNLAYLSDCAVSCRELPRLPGAPLLLLNVPSEATTDVSRRDNGDPEPGVVRYAFADATESASANPTVLASLQAALRNKSRLGEVVEYLNGLLARQPKKFQAEVNLDKDLQQREFSEAKP
jgi:WD40 repeat protein